jgi:23S rRNA (uracil1939-C5)-methyltransferase
LRLKIEKMVYGGYGLARKGEKTFFITGSYPDEEVEAKITRQKKDVYFGHAHEILAPSKFRISPSCKYFKKCGGCEWMDVSYSQQLEFKKEIFVEQMRRFAKHEIEEPLIFSTREKHYRNKAEFVVRNSKLGFFQRKSHTFVEIEECEILSKKINEVKKRIENVLKVHTRFSSKIDHVILRESDGQTMVVFTSTTDVTPPFIEGVDNVVTLKRKGHSHVVISGREKVHQGKNTLIAKINNVKYEVPAKSFFQINDEGARILANFVKDYAGQGKNALDLYCGIGFFALQLHDKFEKILGVESSPVSVTFAKRNAKINKFSNVEFDVKKAEELNSLERFDVVIVDPPRSGLVNAIERIATLARKRIVYVSCDSSTFARDAKFLEEKGFSLKDVKLIDMFPQTHHFEIVSLFERIGSLQFSVE